MDLKTVLNVDMEQKDELYYDAMEELNVGDWESAIELLQEALLLDDDYVQTYVGLVSAYSVKGDEKRKQEAIKIAFEKVKKEFPKWPEEMLWGHMSNRANMRAIQYMGDMYWDNGEDEKAIEIFRALLKMNPNDNQGVRYEIAGLYAGITGDDINRMFDEGNEKQNWDKLEKLVEEQNKKHQFWVEPDFE